MKRLALLLLALCATFSIAAPASAITVETSGEMDFIFGYSKNGSFQDIPEDNFFARQRSRLQVDFIASENLRGVIQVQLGDKDDALAWGDSNTGGALDTTSTSPFVRRAYIDWNCPHSDLAMKMGLQHLALPSAVAGNPMFDAEAAGVLAGLGLNDNVTLSAFWARPFHDSEAHKLRHNTGDAFALILDAQLDKIQISPWLMYASLGSASGYWDYQNEDLASLYALSGTSDLYAGGLAVSFMLTDSLTVNFDGMYGALNSDGDTPESRGWFVALGVDYSLEFGTPGLVAWYSSGDDRSDVENDNRFGQLPVLGSDGGFVPTRLAFAGSYSCGDDTWLSLSGAGTWGVALQIAEMSFIEDLTHTVRVAYIRGTNDKDMPAYASNLGHAGTSGFFMDTVYLTTRDQAFEINLDSAYNLYDNLDIILELGYIHLDVDKDYNFDYNRENAYNAQITFSYAF